MSRKKREKAAIAKEALKDARVIALGDHGDSYASALSKVISDIDATKGSKQAFLGVEDETLDPSEYATDKQHKLKTKKG